MGKSGDLRASDYRTLFRLIHECRDLGADPVAWRLHLLNRLCACLGAKVGASGVFHGLNCGQFIPVFAVDCGWDNHAQRKAMFEWFKDQAVTGANGGLLPPPPSAREGIMAVARRDVMSDRQWYGSPQFNDYLRRSGLDDLVVSFQPITSPMGQSDGLTLFRPLGERPFSRRDTRVLQVLHHELAPLIGRQLASAGQPSAMQLSPRLRQVLDCLLEGDGEKQVAARLSLTRQTVNQYVKAIYRHFDVTSRAELLARWIRFARGTRSAASPAPVAQLSGAWDRGRIAG